MMVNYRDRDPLHSTHARWRQRLAEVEAEFMACPRWRRGRRERLRDERSQLRLLVYDCDIAAMRRDVRREHP